MKPISPAIECQDGATVSVQASRTHYCTPRTDTGPYSHVEAGFPSVNPPDSWMKYAEEGIDNSIGAMWRDVKNMFDSRNLKFTRELAKTTFKARILKTMPQHIIYPWLPIELVDEFVELHGGKATAEDDPKPGYDWCQRCGEDTWSLELHQCERCGFTD